MASDLKPEATEGLDLICTKTLTPGTEETEKQISPPRLKDTNTEPLKQEVTEGKEFLPWPSS
jgi:hypothetical protein